MEQQVAEAALAMVRPSTDASTRAAASHFLEEWNQTEQAWNVYNKWLASFSVTSQDMELMGTQLLCLTLLQAKIKRQIPRGFTTNNSALYNQLLSLLQRCTNGDSLVKPLCVCTASLAVRCHALQELVTACQSPMSLSPVVALRLLASVPPEAEACQDLTTPQVTKELLPYMEAVLDTCKRALSSNETMAPALEALQNWNQTCQVTLSHLNSPTCGGTEALLPFLVEILSQPQQSESVLIAASRALQEAIIVPTDSCTPSREEAVSIMLNGIANGFVAAPFQNFVENQDVCHALSNLICTLVTEEVDYVSSQPAEPLLMLLLRIQSHPSTQVTIPVLECWLTVQELPTSERHEHWKAPLYRKVVEGLACRVAYPLSFTDWENELDVDPQEFAELRRMVTDVLISCYFLLRVEFLRLLLVSQQSQDWTQTEAALYCLCCVSREVCARVKARAGGSSIRADRDATVQQLLQLLQQFVGIAKNQTHPLVRRGIASFVAAYGPVWSMHCNSEAILQLLAYLRTGSMTEEAATGTRSLYVSCSNKLLEGNSHVALLSSMQETMQAVLLTDDEASMMAVAEGSTRLLAQIKDKSVVRQYLGSIIVMPLMQRTAAAADIVAVQNAESEAAAVAVAKYLRILQVIIRFCDAPLEDGEAHVLSNAVNALWPLLDKITHQCSQYEDVVSEVLAVHGQLLNTVPDLVTPNFPTTVKFAVEVFEQRKLPSALHYVGGAVDVFGSFDDASINSFRELLGHVSTVLVSFVTTEKSPDECPQVIGAFFEMCQRFVLFCPSALITCRDFSTIVSLAVECLTACHGERESVRATLNFLTKLFGWRSLHLSSTSTESMQVMACAIDEQLVRHGEKATKVCIDGLVGGPQMLWPSISDCVFAITMHVAGSNETSPVVEETTIAHQWVFTAISSCKDKNGQPMDLEMCQQIVQILFALSREGPKARPKAKMLMTDFAKICKGEMTKDALLTYSL
jgi:hypothetical protein